MKQQFSTVLLSVMIMITVVLPSFQSPFLIQENKGFELNLNDDTQWNNLPGGDCVLSSMGPVVVKTGSDSKNYLSFPPKSVLREILSRTFIDNLFSLSQKVWVKFTNYHKIFPFAYFW